MNAPRDPKHMAQEPVQPRSGNQPETYTFGHFWVKLIYLVAAFGVLAMGLSFIWAPGKRLLLGETVEARVVRIDRTLPGQEDQSFRYRREFPEERDRSIIFRHYVNVPVDGRMEAYRLGVDCRVKPYVNVNDRIQVCYDPKDPDKIAFAALQARTWGMGLLYTVLGLAFAGTAIPMLWAVGKPIEIDPEAEEESSGEPTPEDIEVAPRDPASGIEPAHPDETGPDEIRPKE